MKKVLSESEVQMVSQIVNRLLANMKKDEQTSELFGETFYHGSVEFYLNEVQLEKLKQILEHLYK